MNVHIIRVDGSEERTQMPFRDIAAAIAANGLDTVNLRDGRVMLVDDNGWEFNVVQTGPNGYSQVPTHARKPFNPKATALYHAVCIPGTTHQIVGDVAIVVDAEVA